MCFTQCMYIVLYKLHGIPIWVQNYFNWIQKCYVYFVSTCLKTAFLKLQPKGNSSCASVMINTWHLKVLRQLHYFFKMFCSDSKFLKGEYYLFLDTSFRYREMKLTFSPPSVRKPRFCFVFKPISFHYH